DLVRKDLFHITGGGGRRIARAMEGHYPDIVTVQRLMDGIDQRREAEPLRIDVIVIVGCIGKRDPYLEYVLNRVPARRGNDLIMPGIERDAVVGLDSGVHM